MVVWDEKQYEVFEALPLKENSSILAKKAEALRLYQMPFLNASCVLVILFSGKNNFKGYQVEELIKHFQGIKDPFNVLVELSFYYNEINCYLLETLSKAKEWDDKWRSL